MSLAASLEVDDFDSVCLSSRTAFSSLTSKVLSSVGTISLMFRIFPGWKWTTSHVAERAQAFQEFIQIWYKKSSQLGLLALQNDSKICCSFSGLCWPLSFCCEAPKKHPPIDKVSGTNMISVARKWCMLHRNVKGDQLFWGYLFVKRVWHDLYWQTHRV